MRGGIDAEDNSGEAGDSEGEEDGPGGDDGFHLGEVGDADRDEDAEEDSDDPAADGEDDGLDEELDDDVFSLRSEGAADADLAGALGDGGEHDIHDTDAADEERNGSDGAEDDVEHALGGLGLAEELERDNEFEVLLLMEVAEEVLDLLLARDDGLRIGHADDEAVEFDALGAHAAGGLLDEEFAKAGAGGGEGDVNVVVDGFALVIAHLGTLLGGSGFIDHADDVVVALFDPDGGFERVLVGEKFPHQVLGDDADISLKALIGGSEETAGDEIEIMDQGIGRESADDLAGFLAAVEADVLADDAHGDDALDTGDGVLNAGDIFISDAVFH